MAIADSATYTAYPNSDIGDVSTVSFNHTRSGSRVYSAVGVSIRSSLDSTNVDFDETALTKVNDDTDTTASHDVWSIAGGPTGTIQVDVDLDGAGRFCVVVGTINDVNQTTPTPNADAFDSGNATTPMDVDVTDTGCDLIIGIKGNRTANETDTPGSGQTDHVRGDSGGTDSNHMCNYFTTKAPDGDGSTNIVWTGDENKWGVWGVGLAEDTGGAADPEAGLVGGKLLGGGLLMQGALVR